MNNFMLDIRALGKAPDSPMLCLSAFSSSHQQVRLARNSIAP
jgi:hypothetical protein